MLRFISDENFNGDIVRGLFLRQPDLDLLRVQDVGLGTVDDPTILSWAAKNNRLLLTHDRATMPDFAYQGEGVKVAAVSEDSPGANAGLKIGDIIKKVKQVNNLFVCIG